MTHREYMNRALELAAEAAQAGEVPVGALIVKNGQVIGEGKNDRESSHSALGHAEINAIAAACKALGTWRLDGCTMYVTLEPCVMCTGAIINSRIDRVVYSLIDFKAGGMGGRVDLLNCGLPHSVDTIIGVGENESLALLDAFFKKLRNKDDR